MDNKRPPDWVSALRFDPVTGRVADTIRNIRIILEYDTNTGGPHYSEVPDDNNPDFFRGKYCGELIPGKQLTIGLYGIPIWRTDYWGDHYWTALDTFGLYEYLEAIYGITDWKKIDAALILSSALTLGYGSGAVEFIRPENLGGATP